MCEDCTFKQLSEGDPLLTEMKGLPGLLRASMGTLLPLLVTIRMVTSTSWALRFFVWAVALQTDVAKPA